MEVKKKRNRRITKASPAIITLCIILLIIQAFSAGAEVVNKEKGPEKETEISKQSVSEKKATEKEAKYVYNPAGKTDPFVSFLTKPGFGKGSKNLSGRDSAPQEEELIASKEPQTELEKIEIPKLTLTAVVKGKNKVWAMVIGPKGRGYFLEKGTKIGTHSGVVDEIVYDEKKTDFGVETIRKVIIKIPYRNRNKEIIYRSLEMELPYKTS